MSLIVWTDSLSVGISSIDEQHKILIKIINDLNDAMEGNETDAFMKEIFQRLSDYTHVHFKYEEDLFDEYGYEDSPAHKAQHEALICTLNDLKQKLDSGEHKIGIEVMQFLNRWLTDHIMKTDHAYTKFLQEKGVE